MVEALAAELDKALIAGYPGLRVTADMYRATRPLAEADELIAFENQVARPFADGRLCLICQYDRDLVVTRANCQPALAAHLPDDRGDCRGYGIMVLDLDYGAVVTITGFPDPALFAAFWLRMARRGSGRARNRR